MLLVPFHLHPPCTPSWLPPFLEGKETPERDWGWPEPCWWVGPLILAEEWMGVRLVEGNSDLSSTQRMSTFCDVQVKGMACQQGCSLQGASHTAGKRWLVGLSALPGCVGVKGISSPKGLLRSLGLPRGATWRNGGAGHGPSEVCCLIWNTIRGVLLSSTRGQQMPCPPNWEGRSTRSWNVGCREEGPHDYCTCRKSLVTETQSGKTNWCTCA